jgi:hypothetical protein
MINAVSNQANLYVPTAQPGAHQPAAKVQQPAEDSVQLSQQAKAAASGDVDHDGDSH